MTKRELKTLFLAMIAANAIAKASKAIGKKKGKGKKKG